MQLHQFSFEKLKVWQLSRKLTVDIFKKTRTFPAEEKFGLISQLRRTAVSVNSNIAEGTTRNSPADQAHFTNLAYSSLMEVFNHLIITQDLEFLLERELDEFRIRVMDISIKLTNLKTAQLNRKNKSGFGPKPS